MDNNYCLSLISRMQEIDEEINRLDIMKKELRLEKMELFDRLLIEEVCKNRKQELLTERRKNVKALQLINKNNC